jgi:hypothetical protein
VPGVVGSPTIRFKAKKCDLSRCDNVVLVGLVFVSQLFFRLSSRKVASKSMDCARQQFGKTLSQTPRKSISFLSRYYFIVLDGFCDSCILVRLLSRVDNIVDHSFISSIYSSRSKPCYVVQTIFQTQSLQYTPGHTINQCHVETIDLLFGHMDGTHRSDDD